MEYYLRYLPDRISKAVAFVPEAVRNAVQEIRLRVNSPLSLTVPGKNYMVTERSGLADRNFAEALIITERDIEDTVNNLCEASYHTQADNIAQGYIVSRNGCRVGVCGEYSRGESISGTGSNYRLIKIKSLNIRIARYKELGDNPVYDLIREKGIVSMLIFSPPSNGKTTFLRCLANTLANGRYDIPVHRVALIDERREIYIESRMGGLLDVYSGIGKAYAIECAVRTMNPEAVICDEVGTSQDSGAILNVQNAGVPFIASTHAASFEQLFLKPNIRNLIESNVFDFAVKLLLQKDTLEYSIYEF